MTAVPWNPHLTWKPKLVIDAKTWPYDPLFDVPPSRPDDCSWSHRTSSPWGRFSYRNVRWPKGAALSTASAAQQLGTVTFTDDVLLPTLYRGTFGVTSSEYVMHTPHEVFTHRPGVNLATGRVLLAGVRMGWMLKLLAHKRSVRKITLVEPVEELLEWYGQDLARKLAFSTGKTIDVVQGAPFVYAGARLSEYDAILFDVWGTYGTAKQSPQWQALRLQAKAAGVKAWAWGG